MKEVLNAKFASGFNFQRDQVRLIEAITNSKRNYFADQDQNPDLSSTKQHNLAEEIMRFVKNEIQKLKNKM